MTVKKELLSSATEKVNHRHQEQLEQIACQQREIEAKISEYAVLAPTSKGRHVLMYCSPYVHARIISGLAHSYLQMTNVATRHVDITPIRTPQARLAAKIRRCAMPRCASSSRSWSAPSAWRSRGRRSTSARRATSSAPRASPSSRSARAAASSTPTPSSGAASPRSSPSATSGWSRGCKRPSSTTRTPRRPKISSAWRSRIGRELDHVKRKSPCSQVVFFIQLVKIEYFFVQSIT